MNKFKVGDRVICIDNYICDLELNKIYTISYIDANDGLFKLLNYHNELGYEFFSPTRFELAHIKEYNNVLEGIINEEN